MFSHLHYLKDGIEEFIWRIEIILVSLTANKAFGLGVCVDMLTDELGALFICPR